MNMDKTQLQSAEFVAASEFARAVKAHGEVAVVDDDYPRVRHWYETALNQLLAAVKANREPEVPVPSVDDVIRISTNMRVHGGSFAQALGRAIAVADTGNLQKIVQTWPELVTKYSAAHWK